MEPIKDCEHCAFFQETRSFIADGFCYARKSKPVPVRKWFTKYKSWVEKGDGDDSKG